MPMYSFHCSRCDKIKDGYRHVSERHNGPECCHQMMTMVIVPPAVAPDLPGYASPVTGKWIEGRSARREDLRRTGCRPYEDGEREEYNRQAAYAEKKDDAERYEAVARTFYALPESRRRALSRG
ncbi:MAG TPA: hypothetical protein DEQ40_02475 [Oxalobacteraceae bacterium]|jgi:hypothetical protein|nr:hypothetical protein [Oxalobacteraceae bacterium]